VTISLMVTATCITVAILQRIHASKPNFAEGLCLLDIANCIAMPPAAFCSAELEAAKAERKRLRDEEKMQLKAIKALQKKKRRLMLAARQLSLSDLRQLSEAAAAAAEAAAEAAPEAGPAAPEEAAPEAAPAAAAAEEDGN
jgi:hypothetical protein